jgi:hypothetical protein
MDYSIESDGDDGSYLAWLIGVCILLSLTSVCVSLRLIFAHLRDFSQPIIQRKIIAILWMVPIYAFTSCLSLEFIEQSMFLDMIRDSYESFVIYTFFALCYCYIGQVDRDHIDPRRIYGALTSRGSVSHLTSAVTYFGVPMEIDLKANPREFAIKCKKYILQFVLIKPLGTVVAITLSQYGLYETGNFSIQNGYIYITVLTHCSISLSMYWMVMFYKAASDALAPFRPIPKFLCIKGVLFFSYWQSVVIAILVKLGWITDIPVIHYTVDHVVSTLQNSLICLEMVGFAIAHSYSFGAESFLVTPSPSRTPHSAGSMFRNAIDLGDMIEDIHEVAPALPIPRFLQKRNSIVTVTPPSSSSVPLIPIPSQQGLEEMRAVLGSNQAEPYAN